MMEKLVIFSTGDIAQLAKYYFNEEKKFEVVAFTVDRDFLEEDTFEGLPVVEFETIENKYPPSEYKMFIAVAYGRMNKVREEKYNQAKVKGYKLVSYISPKATVYDNVQIGENCFIFEDNTVQPYVKIGNNVTLWSGNHIGHHSDIKDHNFITSHVVISGGVIVEPNCFIGVNTTVRDHVVIKRETLIGGGAIIMRDTEEKEVYIPERTKPSGKSSDSIKI